MKSAQREFQKKSFPVQNCMNFQNCVQNFPESRSEKDVYLFKKKKTRAGGGYIFSVTNFTLPKRGRGSRGQGPGAGSGGETPPRSPKLEPLSGGFSAARRSKIKCNFNAAPQADAFSAYFR